MPRGCTRQWLNRPCTATTFSFPRFTFAATSLAMLNPHIQFDRMNLYVMPLGAQGSTVSLGSLDFLGEGQAAVQFAISTKEMGVETQDAGRVSGTGAKGVEQGVVATLPELNLAIMIRLSLVLWAATCFSEAYRQRSDRNCKRNWQADSRIGRRPLRQGWLPLSWR